MTWRELEVQDLPKLKNALVVDVRSPCEFAAERIPQAVNIPLFTDSEREEVGTVYAQEGQIAARRLGLRIISPKIPQIIDQLIGLRKQNTSLVVHCWRGGLRSESVASLLSIAGIDCWRLTGGYKAWRRYVLDEFRSDGYPFNTIVLHGRTGTGKTELLSRLQQSGAQVLDLEALAAHRGSLFGSLGLSAQPTQKNFEGLLWEKVAIMKSGTTFIEAESRKIGKLSLPDFIMRRIESGRRILVTGSMTMRVRRIVECYMPEQTNNDNNIVQQALKLLPTLAGQIGKQKVAELAEMAAQHAFDELVKRLLESYYDPLYDRHLVRFQPFDFEVCGDDSAAAASAILSWSTTANVT